MSMYTPIADLITMWWTPIFVILFVAVLAYALWPRNRNMFSRAAQMPLQDD
jgi:cytochrome c oxidase cbb3-type subunit IV